MIYFNENDIDLASINHFSLISDSQKNEFNSIEMITNWAGRCIKKYKASICACNIRHKKCLNSRILRSLMAFLLSGRDSKMRNRPIIPRSRPAPRDCPIWKSNKLTFL